MTPRGSDHDKLPEAEANAEGAPVRRPYRSPKLRRLGSVRELTLGSNRGKPEGGGTRRPGM